jgi:hypothetical protein
MPDQFAADAKSSWLAESGQSRVLRKIHTEQNLLSVPATAAHTFVLQYIDLINIES